MIPANYNAVLAMKLLSRLRWCVLLVAVSAFAANWTAPVADLAKAIAAASGPGTITLTVTNSASLPKDQVAEIQHALEAQLRTAGVRVGGAANANSDVRVTLSENLQGLVWVAEIVQGNNTQVAMVTVPRTLAPLPAKSAPSMTIRKTLLWMQPTQILDILVLDAASPKARMMVLDAENISSYTIAGDHWQREQQWPITHSRPLPRDLRGLLAAAKDHAVDAYLPGTVCSVNSNAVVCRDSDDAWKIGPRSAFFNSGRNYFTGALVPESEKPLPPFYAMTWLEKQNYSLTVSAGLDGRVRVSDGVNERTLPTATTADWGSDLAAVKSSCGTGAQLLVSPGGDDTSPDALRAYEFPDRDPVLVSTAVEFSGPVMALWSHDGFGAVAIVRNLRTGQYEAYSISILCN